MTGYGYANDNPFSLNDSTGLIAICGVDGAGCPAPNYDKALGLNPDLEIQRDMQRYVDSVTPAYPEPIPDEIQLSAPEHKQAWLFERWKTLSMTPNKAEVADQFRAAFCAEFAHESCAPPGEPSIGDIALGVALIAFPYGRLVKFAGENAYAALASSGALGGVLKEAAAHASFLPGASVGMGSAAWLARASVAANDMTRVGRWMSRSEYEKWLQPVWCRPNQNPV